MISRGGAYSPVGTESNPFNGVLDGNGYTISNLDVSDDVCAGLFAYIGRNGTVENVNIVDFDVTVNGGGEEKVYAGAVAAVNSGTIENCYIKNVTVSVTGNSSLLNKHLYAYAGGIAGSTTGIIRSCKAENADVSVDYKRNYQTERDEKNSTNVYAAGIAGAVADAGQLKDCLVDSKCEISAYAKSSCHDSISLRRPYVKVRAGGITASFANIVNIRNVWSEAVITKCQCERDNVAMSGASWTNNCSAESDVYIPDAPSSHREYITASSKDAVVFPKQISDYTLTYAFSGSENVQYGCSEEQLYPGDCRGRRCSCNNCRSIGRQWRYWHFGRESDCRYV